MAQSEKLEARAAPKFLFYLTDRSRHFRNEGMRV